MKNYSGFSYGLFLFVVWLAVLDIPDVVRVRVVVDAILEVPEDVVEQLLVLGVDSEAPGRRTAFADGALFHDERLGDGRDHSESAPTAVQRAGQRVSGPQHRRELDSVASHVPDRLRRQTKSRRSTTAAPERSCVFSQLYLSLCLEGYVFIGVIGLFVCLLVSRSRKNN